MSILHYDFKGKLYDDWEIGVPFITMPHTITENEALRYCALSGEYNPLYVFKEFAEQSEYKQIIVSPAFVFCLCNGESCLTQSFDGSYIGLLDQQQTFVKPVFVGDTIYLTMTPVEKRLSRKPGRGIITYRMAAYNQEDELVMDGTWVILMATDKEHME